jgi:hypothetical protein
MEPGLPARECGGWGCGRASERGRQIVYGGRRVGTFYRRFSNRSPDRSPVDVVT